MSVGFRQIAASPSPVVSTFFSCSLTFFFSEPATGKLRIRIVIKTASGLFFGKHASLHSQDRKPTKHSAKSLPNCLKKLLPDRGRTPPPPVPVAAESSDGLKSLLFSDDAIRRYF